MALLPTRTTLIYRSETVGEAAWIDPAGADAAYDTTTLIMDQLPRELCDEIVLIFARIAPKNDVLSKRLVCRTFDRLLRPLGLRTVCLDSSRLNRYSKFARPRVDGLQTIGHRCKALHIDMMVLRDDCKMSTSGPW